MLFPDINGLVKVIQTNTEVQLKLLELIGKLNDNTVALTKEMKENNRKPVAYAGPR